MPDLRRVEAVAAALDTTPSSLAFDDQGGFENFVRVEAISHQGEQAEAFEAIPSFFLAEEDVNQNQLRLLKGGPYDCDVLFRADRTDFTTDGHYVVKTRNVLRMVRLSESVAAVGPILLRVDEGERSYAVPQEAITIVGRAIAVWQRL